jgi:hypothetical protein
VEVAVEGTMTAALPAAREASRAPVATPPVALQDPAAAPQARAAGTRVVAAVARRE